MRDPELEPNEEWVRESRSADRATYFDGIVYLDEKLEDPEPFGLGARHPWAKTNRRFDDQWVTIAGGLIDPDPVDVRWLGTYAHAMRLGRPPFDAETGHRLY